jgi:gluconokinase
MHGLIGLDAQCRPLTPLVTWADSRGHLEARELRKQGLARVLLHPHRYTRASDEPAGQTDLV